MPRKYDLSRMLEEIERDEKTAPKKTARASQDRIKELLRRKKGAAGAREGGND